MISWRFPTVLTLLLALLPAQAHEMWLEPRGNDLSDYQVDLIVGQNFQGGAGVWIPPSVARAEWISGQDVQVIESRYGDVPGIRLSDVKPGDTLIYQSIPEVLRYSDVEKFRAFGEEKGYPNLPERHAQRGFSQPIVEAYSRYAKLLVPGPVDDQRRELKIEWVLDSSGQRAQLWYDERPLADHMVTVFQKHRAGSLRTDSGGWIQLDLPEGRPVLLDTVVIEPQMPRGTRGADQAHWVSHWASLYFVP